MQLMQCILEFGILAELFIIMCFFTLELTGKISEVNLLRA